MTDKATYRVMQPGLFGADGKEIAVGSEFQLSEVPAHMSSRLVKVDDLKSGAAFIVGHQPKADTTSGGEKAEDGDNYDKMTVVALTELAAGRQPPVVLETSDRKADIIAKLKAADEAKPGDDEGAGEIDRKALEESAKTLDVEFDDSMSDEDLLKAVNEKLGD